MTIKTLYVFLGLNLAITLICAILGEFNWLLNIQVAFFSSIFVTLGSYFGYKRNIQRRVEGHQNIDDNYDELEKMDDTYDLYSPDVPQQEEKQEMTKEQIKEEIKKNKEALKKNNTKNFFGAFGAMSSIYRIAGYVFLIIGFFYLNNNGYLEVIPYVIGFLIVPVGALLLNFMLKDQGASKSL